MSKGVFAIWADICNANNQSVSQSMIKILENTKAEKTPRSSEIVFLIIIVHIAGCFLHQTDEVKTANSSQHRLGLWGHSGPFY